jgi:anti-sigma regulatory factor (Ser/Thr protein kinase)
VNETNAGVHGCYTHQLLIHDTDDALVAGTAAFVELGLSCGGRVLVHSCEDRVALLRAALGTHRRLDYGFDRDLYVSPMSTLFKYERELARGPHASGLWVTGTVPFGSDHSAHPAWTRYESLVNEVLGPYPFHALCTYDTRALPAAVVGAARATHPCISNGVRQDDNPGYMQPVDFMTDPRAGSPSPPTSPPLAVITVNHTRDLRLARHLIAEVADAASVVDRDNIEGFVTAVNEVLANGLRHGRPPVELKVWVDTAQLTCLVTDNGPGIANPLTGYRSPGASVDSSRGLWLARQLCDELIIRNTDDGRCSVLMTIA